MKRLRVRFTQTARDHLRAVKTWRDENDVDTTIVSDEVADAVLLLSLLPGVGSPYAAGGISGLRRLYLRRISYHLYYTYAEDEVIVRAFWNARRGSGPDLGS